MTSIHASAFAVVFICVGCAPETETRMNDPMTVVTTPVATPSSTAMTGLGAAGAAPNGPSHDMTSHAAPGSTPPAAPATPPMASATPPSPSAAGAPAPALPPPSASAPPPAKPAQMVAGASMAPPPPAAAASGGGTAADTFCDKYGEHCGYAKPNRHADRAACIADFNATPAQQFCKTMHLDTAIAGTAAACNGMPSEFCFSIHCLHAAGITDPTGTTYCK